MIRVVEPRAGRDQTSGMRLKLKSKPQRAAITPEPRQKRSRRHDGAGGEEPDKGTERWPAEVIRPGDWIMLPKALIKGTRRLKLRPHHVWLLLALQLDRYRDRPPRYYWAQLADWAGFGAGTVARWARELKQKGLLAYKQPLVFAADEQRWPGQRNDRNEFYLEAFEQRLVVVHEELDSAAAKKKRRRKR